MAQTGYNEADSRTKLIDPALRERDWLEFVPEDKRGTHGEIHREQSVVRVDIIDGKPVKNGRGRVDYLLRMYAPPHAHPLTLAYVEAKREKLLPTTGLEPPKTWVLDRSSIK